MARAPRAAIIVTGDEVLRGRIADRNGGYLAAWCDAGGIEVARLTIVGDDPAAIADAVRAELGAGTELVITTGGLGVTHDDLTMAAVAAATGLPLELDPPRWRPSTPQPQRRHTWTACPPTFVTPPSASRRCCRAAPTCWRPIGTAPGCIVRVGASGSSCCPDRPTRPSECGPPRSVIPPSPRSSRTPADRRAWCCGCTASSRASWWPRSTASPHSVQYGARLGICAKAGEVELTLADLADGGSARLAAAIDAAFPGATFTRTGEPVEAVVGRLLLEQGARLVVAESCTGGLLGGRLTALAGASRWFLGGVIAYDNAVKQSELGVPEHVLATAGAVSAPAARAMAEGARVRLGADWGLSVTGIAGPDGGTPDKPVGTVFLGCAGPDGVTVEAHRFRGDRALVRERSCVYALHLLRRRLTDPPG